MVLLNLIQAHAGHMQDIVTIVIVIVTVIAADYHQSSTHDDGEDYSLLFFVC